MPDRYVSDTSDITMTITQPKWVTTYQNVCHDVYDWQWPYTLTSMGLATASSESGDLIFSAPTVNDAISFEVAVQPNTLNVLALDLTTVANTDINSRISILEYNDGIYTEIGSTRITQGINRVSFSPKHSTITWQVLGPYWVKVGTVCVVQAVLQQQSVLVDVSSTDGDRYRFGFNGQEKVNEWSGVGNHNEFKERGQDSRIGRFLSIDPIANKYLWNSPYNFAEDRVIDGIDLEGKEWYYTSDGKKIGKYGTSTEVRVVNDDQVKKAQDAFKKFYNDDKPSNETKSGNYLKNELGTDNLSHSAFTKTEDAANDWGLKNNSISIKKGKEYTSILYKITIDGTGYIFYSNAKAQKKASGNVDKAPPGSTPVADIHSHGKYLKEYANNIFSPQDKSDNDKKGYPGYLTTPSGTLQVYNPNPATGESPIQTLSTDLPYDTKDPESPKMAAPAPATDTQNTQK